MGRIQHPKDHLQTNIEQGCMNTSEEIFKKHSVKLVKPIPNQAEMCNFTSAGYEDILLVNEQNDCIVVAKRKSKSKQTKKLITAEQEVKLKPPTYKIKPPPNMPKKQMVDTKLTW
jgi:hypothetical protein